MKPATTVLSGIYNPRWLTLLFLLMFINVFVYGETKNIEPAEAEEKAEDAPEKKKQMSPGKVDLLVKSNSSSTDYNFILWTPIVKGGFGYINLPGSVYSTYGGAFVRPLQYLKNNGNDKGELLVAFNYAYHHMTAATAPRDFNGFYWESQAEYRFKFGLCLGGGLIDAEQFESPAGPPRDNDYFFKGGYRGKFGEGWNYTLTAQIQEVGDEISPGGYAAIYGNPGSIAGGYDGESWRGSIGWICKKNDALLKPAVEVLYIDKTLGDNELAPKIVWVNGTLKFKGGFLSNGGRLGRAMGATGLEYGNPLPHLIPLTDGNPIFKKFGNPTPAIWNRALNAWELGGLINTRVLHFILPDESKWGRAELDIFPFQFATSIKNFLNNVFVGAAYFYYRENKDKPTAAQLPDMDAPIVQGGFIQRVGPLHVTFEVEYDTENKTTQVFAGIINWF